MASRAQERVDEELGALAASPLDEPVAEQMRALLAPAVPRRGGGGGGATAARKTSPPDAGRAGASGGGRR